MSASATLILWGHALAALVFGGLTIDRARRHVAGWPRRGLIVALALTALWALAVAGIEPRDFTTRLAESARNIAWLAVLLTWIGRERVGGWTVTALGAVAIAVAISSAILAAVAAVPIPAADVAAVLQARLLCRMLGTVASLILVHHLCIAAPRAQPLGIALVMIWGVDLASYATGYAMGGWPVQLVAVRGFSAAAAAALLAVALKRGDREFTLSRGGALRIVAVAALAAYLGATILVADAASHWAGAYGRAAQTAIVLGAATALITLLSTPWLRAWGRVMIAKHLFTYRYDYRTEWQRVTTALGGSGGDGAPIGCRAIRAMADMIDSPGGVLLLREGDTLDVAASWNWADGEGAGSALVGHLATTTRIVSLDAVRAGTATPGDIAAAQGWPAEREDAWAIVPLFHGAMLVGAIVLARPPVERPLDWEDFDLLRVAGRQAASYLAEDRARHALAEAERFDEFNRRFAFILHDLKNLVSGLTLVARNAERHADNPAFRADMVATLQDSAARMNALLARLASHHHSADEPASVVDVGTLATRIAERRRAQHAIVVSGTALALAQPRALEQLLEHLCQNAIEATGGSAPVAIEVAMDSEGVGIDVVDRGCGMTASFVREQLFRPFASSKPGGFGIGAYEARQLAEAMGGRVEVTSRVGEGTRFRVVLPAAPAMEAAA
ncbi:putative PEP-CTERM system histidine kinase [Sphingomonas jinjuensis]|uniref:histidine kinase n=1 Tax=Sphingomonas jinjuensis TaxID=535907 RepID=A0A840FD94_9SPHN|nr:XrtA/PEP-CTERM system histidine kinase PrsK [Sphingomonas jinjuensis]MBB4154612.1 putative PEP-CTERM system histidine kinase [Sphingomonas jinjuensis]